MTFDHQPTNWIERVSVLSEEQGLKDQKPKDLFLLFFIIFISGTMISPANCEPHVYMYTYRIKCPNTQHLLLHQTLYFIVVQLQGYNRFISMALKHKSGNAVRFEINFEQRR